MANPLEELTLKAAELARWSPDGWAGFVAAFRSYTDNVRDQCVASTLEDLQRTQGRAQQCKALADLFGNAVTAADRIIERRK